MIVEDGFEIFESSLNGKQKEKFDIVESTATFSHKEFLQEVKDEMKFYEMSVESLSKSLNISNFRLSALLNGRAEFDHQERELIKRRLHI